MELKRKELGEEAKAKAEEKDREPFGAKEDVSGLSAGEELKEPPPAQTSEVTR